MDYDEVMLDTEERMEKTLDNYKENVRGIRTGRAQPSLVENIKAQYYGSPTPIKQIANIAAPEPQMLVVKAFDASCLGEIEKAILKANIGLTPQNDGKLIRLNIPPLSEENRKQLVGRAKDLNEEAKVSMRNIRRDSNKNAEKLEKDKVISEDEGKQLKDEIQEMTKKFSEQADEILKKKTEELLDG